MSIPIVGADCTIVGWTETIPQVVGARLRHAEAERLVGGLVVATYVEMSDARAAAKAGAPPHWKGPWRCLGLCVEHLVGTSGGEPISTLRVRLPEQNR